MVSMIQSETHYRCDRQDWPKFKEKSAIFNLLSPKGLMPQDPQKNLHLRPIHIRSQEEFT